MPKVDGLELLQRLGMKEHGKFSGWLEFRGCVWLLTRPGLVLQPMRCLCEAKVCRGFIGGTGEAVAQEQDLEDPADASEDPEPIMVSENEATEPALVAILESEVGLASEFWDATAWQRWGSSSSCKFAYCVTGMRKASGGS